MPITEGQPDYATDASGRHAVSVYDGTNFWHQRGGKFFLAPAVVVNTGAYTPGMVVGGELLLAGACPASGLGSTLESIIVEDAADQKAGLLFLFFNANPAGTYTDHAAPTYNAADLTTNFLGRARVDPADYDSIGSGRAVATVEPFLPLKPAAGNDIYCVILVPVSTPTYGASGALYVKFGLS